MSDVISFRLNKCNPQEEQALEILSGWMSKGYNVRFIIAQALLKLGFPELESEGNCSSCELDLVLSQLGELLTIVKSGETTSFVSHNSNEENLRLNEKFISSIKIGVKPGIQNG